MLQNFGCNHEIKWLLFAERVNCHESNVRRKIGVAGGFDRPDIDVSAKELAITENSCERHGKIGPRAAADIENTRRIVGLYRCGDKIQPLAPSVGILSKQ